MSWVALLATWSLFVVVTGCSANAAKDTPCVRKCGSRTVTGGKIRVISLNGEGSLSCANVGSSIGKPVELNFLVYDDHTPATTSSSQTDTEQTKVKSPTPDRIPMGGVAFYPAIVGITTQTDGALKGADTPSDQWCTDSCGIATLSFTPTCLKQEMAVGVIIPGLDGSGAESNEGKPSIPFTKITIKTD